MSTEKDTYKKPLHLIKVRCASLPHLNSEELNRALTGETQFEWYVGDHRMHILAGPLSTKQMERYQQSTERHYINFDKKSEKDYERNEKRNRASASSIFFQFCTINNLPHITIDNAGKYSAVHVDFITTDGAEKYRDIQEKMLPIFERFTFRRKGAMWAASANCYMYSNSIPQDKAEEVAAELWRIRGGEYLQNHPFRGTINDATSRPQTRRHDNCLLQKNGSRRG